MSNKLPNTVTKDELKKGHWYFVLTTTLFGAYAMWTGEQWRYLDDGEEHIMAYGITQIVYEAPQP
jgi:hypothetical protein